MLKRKKKRRNIKKHFKEINQELEHPSLFYCWDPTCSERIPIADEYILSFDIILIFRTKYCVRCMFLLININELIFALSIFLEIHLYFPLFLQYLYEVSYIHIKYLFIRILGAIPCLALGAPITPPPRLILDFFSK